MRQRAQYINKNMQQSIRSVVVSTISEREREREAKTTTVFNWISKQFLQLCKNVYDCNAYRILIAYGCT